MPVSVVNTFALRAGIAADDFDTFSRDLDRPTCLAFDEVLAFDVHIVERDHPQGASTPVDVIEVMTVTDWTDWERIRDNAPELAPVTRRFTELVDDSSVQTYFLRPSPNRGA